MIRSLLLPTGELDPSSVFKWCRVGKIIKIFPGVSENASLVYHVSSILASIDIGKLIHCSLGNL